MYLWWIWFCEGDISVFDESDSVNVVLFVFDESDSSSFFSFDNYGNTSVVHYISYVLGIDCE